MLGDGRSEGDAVHTRESVCADASSLGVVGAPSAMSRTPFSCHRAPGTWPSELGHLVPYYDSSLAGAGPGGRTLGRSGSQWDLPETTLPAPWRFAPHRWLVGPRIDRSDPSPRPVGWSLNGRRVVLSLLHRPSHPSLNGWAGILRSPGLATAQTPAGGPHGRVGRDWGLTPGLPSSKSRASGGAAVGPSTWGQKWGLGVTPGGKAGPADSPAAGRGSDEGVCPEGPLVIRLVFLALVCAGATGALSPKAPWLARESCSRAPAFSPFSGEMDVCEARRPESVKVWQVLAV